MLKQLFLIGEPHLHAKEKILSLRIGEKHLGYSISDARGSSMDMLAYFSAKEMNAESLSALIDQNVVLTESFNEVLVGFDYPQATLVPDALNQPGSAALILSTIYGVNGQSTILQDAVRPWQLQTIYAIPTVIHQWVSKQFPDSRYWHQYTIAMKNLKPAAAEGHLLLELRMEDLSIILSANGKLLLAQTYEYSTPADVLYYLLRSCEEFNLSPGNIIVEISGLMEKDSALFRELWQYFPHPSFRNPEWKLAPGTSNDAIHFFTSFNDLARCVS